MYDVGEHRSLWCAVPRGLNFEQEFPLVKLHPTGRNIDTIFIYGQIWPYFLPGKRVGVVGVGGVDNLETGQKFLLSDEIGLEKLSMLEAQ